MPVSKTFVEGNVRTEILDLREGVGEHRSIDEILSKTGGATGTYEEVGEDGTKYTYSVEVEEVSETDDATIFRCVRHDVTFVTFDF
jgi:hypothetical protein